LSYALDYPWVLLGALVLGAAAVGIVWLEFVRRRARLARLGTVSTLERLVPRDVVHSRLGRRPVWLGLAAVLAGIALAGPRWGIPNGEAETEGIDVVYAVDASLSMLAEDESPNRLERAKHEARRLRALSRGDRVALIAFAGRSYILTPLTADDGALALFLDNLDPSIVGQPGSSLASAIRQGVDLLGPAVGSDRAVVVFTDGEAFDEASAVIAAAKRAHDAGVALVLVGFGTMDGATIPIKVGYEAFAPKRDDKGQVVTTRYDSRLMHSVAEAAEGTLIGPETTDKASRVRAALMGLRAERRRVNSQRSIPARYQWFLGPALLLLLWDLLATGRRRARVAVALSLVTSLTPRVSHAQARKVIVEAEKQAKAQRPLPAARAFRRAIDAGDRHPQTLYNLGTSYLAADSLDAAIEVLERASTTPSKSLHADVLYNLGLAYLRRGLTQKGEAASSSYKGAVRAYRSVLLGDPKDGDARWNYELSKKKEQEASNSPGGGGGRGGQNQPQENPQGGGLAKDQAAQLLDAAARDERDVRDKHQRAEQVKTVRGKDW
jgi:Ca-activated chloride channel family protein